MSYLVLARKWRPQSFSDVVSQKHVIQALQNAIRLKRLPHALLLTGSRGIGKTTIARIVAKTVNCLNLDTEAEYPNPCNECSVCLEITEGRSTDITEIDGASNRSIDDIRELRENVQYLPTHARRKVYIIDEVHMLTREAFNALLKTLEEPPEHVLFLFATTEPHKIPITILSRCQRFDFKRITGQEQLDYLRHISDTEGLTISDVSLNLVVRAADGGMRDALSLLDQVIAYGGKSPSDEEVAQAIGAIDRTILHRIGEALLNRDIDTTLQLLDQLLSHAYDLRHLTQELAHMLRDLMVIAVCENLSEVTDLTEEEIQIYRKILEGHTPDRVQQMFRILTKAAEDIARANYPRLLLEMTLIQMARVEPVRAFDDVIRQLHTLESRLLKMPAGGPPSGSSSSGGSSPGGGSSSGNPNSGGPPPSSGGGSPGMQASSQTQAPSGMQASPPSQTTPAPTFSELPRRETPQPVERSQPPSSAGMSGSVQRVTSTSASSPAVSATVSAPSFSGGNSSSEPPPRSEPMTNGSYGSAPPIDMSFDPDPLYALNEPPKPTRASKKKKDEWKPPTLDLSKPPSTPAPEPPANGTSKPAKPQKEELDASTFLPDSLRAIADKASSGQALSDEVIGFSEEEPDAEALQKMAFGGKPGELSPEEVKSILAGRPELHNQNAELSVEKWRELVAEFRENSPFVGESLQFARYVIGGNNVIKLIFPSSGGLRFDRLRDPEVRDSFEGFCAERGVTVQLDVELHETDELPDFYDYSIWERKMAQRAKKIQEIRNEAERHPVIRGILDKIPGTEILNVAPLRLDDDEPKPPSA
ncbi:MAG: DNA polymerase III subunit gamma/tau [Deltaproteobacteria bacterium]|nr:MAG: DNA polymerase III subunit gamma/tau [Deltaproteobacteria bacterium]